MTEQEPVPPVHIYWLNYSDLQERVDKHIGDEVNKRLKMEHEKVVQDEGIMHNNWSNFPHPTTTVLAPPHTQKIEEVAISDAESDNETEVPSLIIWRRSKDSERKVRRQLGRRYKQ